MDSIIDFRNPYVWDDLNDAVKQALNSSVPARVYQSVNHALLEIAISLQGLYSQKRQYLTTLNGLGTHTEDMTVYLSRQGIKFVAQELSANLDDLDEKKILFWVLDRDDAITGQKYISENQLKSDSKIFRIWISHSLHLVQGIDKNIPESDIYIFSHPQTGGAIALFGRRTQNINSLYCPTLDWKDFFSLCEFTKNYEKKDWVETMESKDHMGSQRLMQSVSERIYDRAIIYWKNFDASAIRDLLIRDFQLDEKDIECLSLSKWLDTRLLHQFQKRGWDAETYRGTLIMSSRLSVDKNFENSLLKVLHKLKAMSDLST